MEIINEVIENDYKYGFTTNIESDNAPKGLNEGIVRFISAKKEEPEWMLEFRLTAYKKWLSMQEPDWAKVNYVKPNYDEIIFYSAPKQKKVLNSLDEVDP
jgi:Fe-S cluster assembly protein SufB